MIRSLIIPVGLCLVAAISLLSQTPGQQQQIQVHSRQAQQYLREKRPDLAIGEFKAILAIDSDNLDARANLGVLEYFQGQYTQAAPDLQSALKINPSLWKLEALLGMSQKRLGENTKAQASLEEAFPRLQERKVQIEAGLELIEVDYALRDLAKASGVVNVLRQLEPTDVNVLYTAHRIYSDLSDEAMLSLAMVAPDSARMHQVMAHELARQAKDDAAIENYRIALKIDPQRADIHYELAEMLNTEPSPAARAEAEKEYKAALAGNPFDEKSECRLGDISMRRTDLKDAMPYYARALEMQPNDPDANLGMAKVLMAMHEQKKALPHLERAARLEPFDPTTHYRLGVLYRELGRIDDSHRELAEFEKLKKTRNKLQEIYEAMRLQPADRSQPDTDIEK